MVAGLIQKKKIATLLIADCGEEDRLRKEV
jgi:hypothetical protein